MHYSGMINLPYFGELRIQRSGWNAVESDWSWETRPRHDWGGLLLWVVAEGQGQIDSTDLPATQILSRGDILFLRWDRRQQARTDVEQPLEIPWCSLDWSQEADRQAWCSEAPSLMLRHARDPGFAIAAMQRFIQCNSLQQPQAAQIYLRTVIAEFAASPRHGSQNKDTWVHRIRAWCLQIQQHPEQPWSIRDLAERHHCSTDHAARMFKRSMGVSPQHYIIRSRIDRAQQVLISSKDPLNVIAQRLGYEDEFFFAKQFKQYTGISPGRYREKPPNP